MFCNSNTSTSEPHPPIESPPPAFTHALLNFTSYLEGIVRRRREEIELDFKRMRENLLKQDRELVAFQEEIKLLAHQCHSVVQPKELEMIAQGLNQYVQQHIGDFETVATPPTDVAQENNADRHLQEVLDGIAHWAEDKSVSPEDPGTPLDGIDAPYEQISESTGKNLGKPTGKQLKQLEQLRENGGWKTDENLRCAGDSTATSGMSTAEGSVKAEGADELKEDFLDESVGNSREKQAGEAGQDVDESALKMGSRDICGIPAEEVFKKLNEKSELEELTTKKKAKGPPVKPTKQKKKNSTAKLLSEAKSKRPNPKLRQCDKVDYHFIVKPKSALGLL